MELLTNDRLRASPPWLLLPVECKQLLHTSESTDSMFMNRNVTGELTWRISAEEAGIGTLGTEGGEVGTRRPTTRVLNTKIGTGGRWLSADTVA